MPKKTPNIKWIVGILSLVTVTAMWAFGHDFVIASRITKAAPISILYVFIAVFVAFVPGFFLRNLGAILAVLSAGFIAGGTLATVIRASMWGFALSMSPFQVLLAILIVAGAVVALCDLDVDWSDFGIADLFH